MQISLLGATVTSSNRSLCRQLDEQVRHFFEKRILSKLDWQMSYNCPTTSAFVQDCPSRIGHQKRRRPCRHALSCPAQAVKEGRRAANPAEMQFLKAAAPLWALLAAPNTTKLWCGHAPARHNLFKDVLSLNMLLDVLNEFWLVVSSMVNGLSILRGTMIPELKPLRWYWLVLWWWESQCCGCVQNVRNSLHILDDLKVFQKFRKLWVVILEWSFLDGHSTIFSSCNHFIPIREHWQSLC